MIPMPTRGTPPRATSLSLASVLVVLPIAALVAGQIGPLDLLPAQAAAAQFADARGASARSADAQAAHAQVADARAAHAQVADARAVVEPSAGGRDVTLMVGGYQVLGRFDDLVDDPQTVFADLLGADGSLRASTTVESTAQGAVELAFTTRDLAPRRPVLLRPGDTVSLRLGAPDAAPTEYEVGTIAAEADPTTDVVRGSAPPGTSVTVTARSGDSRASRTVAADADGSWSADFAGDVDIDAGSRGIAMWADESDGDYIANQAGWLVRDLVIEYGSDTIEMPALPGEVAQVDVAFGVGSRITASTAVAWDDEIELWLHTADGAPIRLAGATTVTVTFNNAEELARDVPFVSGRVLPEHNIVHGEAPPNETVTVTAGSVVSSTVADVTGSWAFQFEPEDGITEDSIVDVQFDGRPWLRYGTRASQVVAADPHVARVEVTGHPNDRAMLSVDRPGHRSDSSGGSMPPRGGVLELVAADETGSVLRWMQGDQASIWGYKVRQKVFEAAPLSAAVDVISNTISGTTVPSATVEVAVLGSIVPVTSSLDGVWLAQLDPELELAPGTPVELKITGRDAYRSSAEFPVFQASAHVGGSRVWIDGPPSLTGNVEVVRDGTTVATGACRVERTRCEVNVWDSLGESVVLRPGDTVRVEPDAGQTAVLDVVPLTAHIDPSGSDVVGQAPPNTEVHIEFGAAPGATFPLLRPRDATTRVFRSGVYDYELLGSELELVQPGLLADVFFDLPNGHRLFAVGAMEVVWAEPGSATVKGVAEPRSAVTATWRLEDGSVAASGSAMAGDTGVFHAELLDAEAAHTYLGSRGTLTVEHGRGTRSFELEEVLAWRWGVFGTVLGRAASGAPVVAVHRRTAAAPSGGPHVVAGTTDAYGWIDLVSPGVDAAFVDHIELISQLPTGDEIHALVEDAPPGRAYLPLLQPATDSTYAAATPRERR